jgi:hypothetical protein
MKNKIWMTVLALSCLVIGLLSSGCAAPQAGQRSEREQRSGIGVSSELPDNLKQKGSDRPVTW